MRDMRNTKSFLSDYVGLRYMENFEDLANHFTILGCLLTQVSKRKNDNSERLFSICLSEYENKLS